jgi:transcriptional pleiotropic regulator of transition state genes
MIDTFCVSKTRKGDRELKMPQFQAPVRGFVRSVDSLGRVVLPIEWRRSCTIEPGDSLEMVPGANGTLVLQLYRPASACLFCSGSDRIRYFSGRPICAECSTALARIEDATGVVGGIQNG